MGVSIRGIANIYKDKCSRRLIQFVLFPEREKHCAELYKERAKDGRYYHKKRHTAYMRKYRRRKKAFMG